MGYKDDRIALLEEKQKLAIDELLALRGRLLSQAKENSRLTGNIKTFLDPVWRVDSVLEILGFSDFKSLEHTYRE